MRTVPLPIMMRLIGRFEVRKEAFPGVAKRLFYGSINRGDGIRVEKILVERLVM